MHISKLKFIATLLAMCSIASAASAAGSACPDAKLPVDQAQFISIGAIEQWVTIKGARCGNPAILFLHGGPGNTMSPYADAIYGAWEKEFTLVQWDQRGAGRTYGRNPPTEDSMLTLEQMSADGIALAEYLASQLGQKKIILIGGSWGSILGVHMVKSRPDLFHAWVGVSQLVSYRDNEIASYSKVLDLARAAKDAATVAALEALGPPPWTNPRNFGVLRRATRVYEGKVSKPAPATWWVGDSDYTSAQMQKDYTDGEDYSFLQFVGFKGNGMFSRVDLPSLGLEFKVPVFMIHGAQDLVATPDVAKRYFDDLTAPAKHFVLLQDTGHDPNQALIDAELEIMRKHVRPLIR